MIFVLASVEFLSFSVLYTACYLPVSFNLMNQDMSFNFDLTMELSYHLNIRSRDILI